MPKRPERTKAIYRVVHREIHGRDGIGWEGVDASVSREITVALLRRIQAVLDEYDRHTKETT